MASSGNWDPSETNCGSTKTACRTANSNQDTAIEDRVSDHGGLQNEARNQAFMDGIGVVVGTGLAFLVAVAGFRRLVRNSTDLKQGQERPASA